MNKRLLTADAVREALEGFVAAGLVSTALNEDPEERPAADVTPSHGASRSGRKGDQLRPGRQSERQRKLARIPVKLPSGETVTVTPGGQNLLIKAVVEGFCPRFVPGGTVICIGDAENKFLHLDAGYLQRLGVAVPSPSKMPDVVVHDTRRNWLLLIEAVTTAGPVDGKRRKELKELFSGSSPGLVFVSAFSGRETMRSFLTHISWGTEVWVADDPDHIIHFNGERFLGPYPDVTASALAVMKDGGNSGAPGTVLLQPAAEQ